MNTTKNRLEALEEKSEFERFKRQQAAFAKRGEDDLEFFATHSRFPDDPAIEPGTREFIVNGWKTTVTLEKL